jgi:hypothetical protein
VGPVHPAAAEDVSQTKPGHSPSGLAVMIWTSKSSSRSSIVWTNPGKLARSCSCAYFMFPVARDQEQQVDLALAPRRLDGAEVGVGPDVSDRSRCSIRPNCRSSCLRGRWTRCRRWTSCHSVDSDTLVTAGPDEKPVGATSPQAARASAARSDRTNFPYHQRQEPARPGSLALGNGRPEAYPFEGYGHWALLFCVDPDLTRLKGYL